MRGVCVMMGKAEVIGDLNMQDKKGLPMRMVV
jgi:hypothetical protein